jgi:hypothetical protein
MIDCEVIENCIFFNEKMGNMPFASNMYKSKYCRDDFNSCARYYVRSKLGRDKVPTTLFPNQMEKAIEIVKENQ